MLITLFVNTFKTLYINEYKYYNIIILNNDLIQTGVKTLGLIGSHVKIIYRCVKNIYTKPEGNYGMKE